ncbi:MAG: hypothetical protein CMP41_02885 [Rickettsiales bacterium]|nr:hypothetical protein [Rickettsiales bacterium]
MHKLLLTLFILVNVFLKNTGQARPISYPGGWTLMQMNDLNRHSVHAHYSPSASYSLGYRGEYWRQKEWQFHGIQFNYLIKRLNTSKSQMNFYLKNASGLALSDYKNLESKIRPSLFSGISLDWEDRQYYVSYENRLNYSPTIDNFFLQKARIGFAPYIGKYGDLHTWFMFQIENMSKSKHKIIYTPMLRFFKGDYLVETGLSNNKNFMFNFIKRF